MIRLLSIRTGELVLTVLGIYAVLFFLVRVTGDPVALILGPSATTEQIEALREAMGLDRPLLVQFFRELGDLLRFDFGESIRGGQDAMALAIDRLGTTLILVLGALVLAVVTALPVGIYAAVRRDSTVSRLLMSMTFVGQAVPIFLTGPVLILVFAVLLGLLPTSGWGRFEHWVLPMVTLSLVMMARVARLARAHMIDVLDQDYVRTAVSKGLSPYRVLVVHGLRNALIPLVTVIGADLGQIVGSGVLTETIFAVPGIGQMLLTAALGRDYPLLQAGVFLIAIFVIALNFATDLLYRALDPRLRRRG